MASPARLPRHGQAHHGGVRLMQRQPRYCPRCKAPVAWERQRPEGARCSRFVCLTCGANTKRITRGKHKPKLPSGLAEYKAWTKRADEAWRHLIYRKTEHRSNSWYCLCCKKWQWGTQAAHCIERGVKRGGLRWDLDNGLPICGGCHLRIEKDRQATDALFAEHIGQERLDRLHWLERYGQPCRLPDLQLICLDLERRLGSV